MTTYIPVSCELHTELELSVIKRKKLSITITKSPNEIEIEPLDILTMDKSEFLRAKKDNGEIIDIRLDFIKSYQIL